MQVMLVPGECFYKKIKMVLIVLFVVSDMNLSNTRKYIPRLKKSVLPQFFLFILCGPCFILFFPSVFTDHNPLTFLQKMKNKNQRLLRWNLLLQEYNLNLTHIKGRGNILVIADALSRSE